MITDTVTCYLVAASNGGAAFDSATKGANVTLSNSDYTATKSSTGISGAKTAYGKKTGKYYFEAVLTNRVSPSGGVAIVNEVGLSRVDFGYEGYCVPAFGAGVFLNQSAAGDMWVDRSNIAALGTPSNGDVYGFAVDLTSGLVWIRRNTGNWNNNGSADPATGVSGSSLGDLAGYSLTPVATFYDALEATTLVTTPGSLTYSAPSGFTAGWDAVSPQDNEGLGYTTFASVKNVNVTLSGGNLTATRTATTALARSRDPKSSGKQYFEFTCTNLGGSADGVGACDVNATAAGITGTSAHAMILFRGGNIWLDGSNTAISLGSIANGDIISLAIDWTNLKFWFRKNGGNWNANATYNPATNVGGITFSNTMASAQGNNITGRALCPCVCFGGGTNANNVTLNAGATSFTYGVPSGFDSGWAVGVTP